MSRWAAFWLGLDYSLSQLIWEDPNITISSKTAEARLEGKKWGCWGCKALNVLFHVPDHCGGALLHDYQRAKAAEAELEKELGNVK